MTPSGSSERIEHRRHSRVSVEAAAVVHVAGGTLHGRIVNLSLGGVRVHCTNSAIPRPAPHATVTIDLELGDGWSEHPGHVRRAVSDEIVVEFEQLAPAAQARIATEVQAALDATHRPRMLVIDPSAERRHRVADALRSAGCDSYEAATPLEAIDLLERPTSHIRGVAVSEHLTQTSADELCDFVADTNPDIRLALIADRDHELSHEPTGEHVAVVADDDTLEIALHEFADSIADGLDKQR